MEIIGHRGASFDAPENTLAAFRLAFAQGADAVECDVRQSRDGTIVVFHDPDTRRTAGVDRPVADQTLAELRALDAGSWKAPAFAGEPIPTLAELLATIPTGKRLYIEVKDGPDIVPELKRVLREAGLGPDRTAVISFDPDVVVAAKKELPDLPVYWVVSVTSREKTWTPDELIRTGRQLAADGLDLSADPAITPAFVRRATAAHLPVYVWTVNDPAVARRLIGAGVRGITTDRPGWLREQLASGPPAFGLHGPGSPEPEPTITDRQPESTPYGPHPHGVDEASGGADSSPFEELPSGEKGAAAQKEKAAGRSDPKPAVDDDRSPCQSPEW